ncbi:MAG: DUF2142 domain-containing protein [Geodermatophilaceae bacterium]
MRGSLIPRAVRDIPVLVRCALALFAAVLVGWTVMTPAYRAPDEPQHVSAVLGLVQGEGWPKPGDANLNPGVLRSQVIIGFVEQQDQPTSRGNTLPGVHIAQGAPAGRALYSAQQPSPPDQRLPYAALAPGGLTDITNQMTQHPPAYYAVQAGVLIVLDAEDWRFDRQLALMRLVSVAMVVWLPLLAYLLVRRLTGSTTLGSAAAFLPIGVPQLVHVGSSVNNDALIVLLGAILVTQLAYVLTGARSTLLLGSIAVVLGIGLVTKGTMLTALPVVAVAVTLGLHSSRSWWRAAAGGLAVLAGAFVVGGWWWGLNLVRYGTVQPNGFGVERARTGRSLPVDEYGAHFLELLNSSAWGNFGWLELPLNTTLTTGLTVGVAVGALAALGSRNARRPLIVLAVFPLVTLAVLFATVYASHLRDGRFNGVQGRYLFGALLTVVAAVAVGLGVLARLARVSERWLVPLAATASAALAAYGALAAFRGFYVDVGVGMGQAWDLMTAWSPWPEWLVDTVAVAAGLLLLLVPVAAIVWAARVGAPARVGVAAGTASTT